jgi:hypothetical protein
MANRLFISIKTKIFLTIDYSAESENLFTLENLAGQYLFKILRFWARKFVPNFVKGGGGSAGTQSLILYFQSLK